MKSETKSNAKHKKSNMSVAQAAGADKYETAFNNTLSARAEIPAESLVARNVDVGGAIAIVLNAIPGMRGYRAELVENFPRLDIKRFDALEEYANAVFHAQGLLTMPETDGLDGLYAGVLHHREMLTSDVKALIKRGLVEVETLNDVTNLAGYKNVALDVNRLCTIARESWDAISNKTALTFDEVEKARSDAGQLLILSGARDTTASEAKDNLHRALTLLVRGYEEARSAIAYLRRDEGDIASIAPSLFANRAAKRKADPTAAGATPAPPIAATPVPSPVVAPAPAPVAVGGETPAPAPVIPLAPSSDVQLTEMSRKSA